MATFAYAALHACEQALRVIKRHHIQGDHIAVCHSLVDQSQFGFVGENRFADKRLATGKLGSSLPISPVAGRL